MEDDINGDLCTKQPGRNVASWLASQAAAAGVWTCPVDAKNNSNINVHKKACGS